MPKNIHRIKMVRDWKYKILILSVISLSVLAGMVLESMTSKAQSVIFSLDNKIISSVGDSTFITGKTIHPAIPIQEYWNNIPLPSNDISVRQVHSRIEIDGAFLSGMILYTGSMKPTLYGGNKVIQVPYRHAYKKQEGNCPDIKEGQLISFVNNVYNISNAQILHRVINNNLNDGNLYTRGDDVKIGEYVRCEDIRYINVGVLWL
ncbi:hypothetical protein LCGC14_0534820 [marine sediment metagenome]|uniref:Uncharacterized protein n=1 Tax=marine sediment metagenome TaxID=412755 RepID=A0A0F9UG27_9ZZZZ